MDVVRGAGQPDGQIVILGVDDIALPEVLRPTGRDLLLQADGAEHWLLVAAEPSDWVAFGADAVRKVPSGSVAFRTPPQAAQLRDFVRGWRLAGYRYEKPSEKQLWVGEASLAEVLEQTDATIAARDLVNTPSNVKNPEWLVRQARRVARRIKAEIKVLGVAELKREGFGGVLAVGSGSASPPRVVILRRPGSGPRIVLVGKGITYDTGGLSIKPRESMALMKTDMAGAAAVLQALTLAPPDADVTVLIGLAENAVGGGSYRPGDVLTHVDGRTSEIRNTDAEGRLVLADLLGYARTRLEPDVMVDVATLTGAATLALSREMGAVFATSQRLADSLVAAGDKAGEQVWRMPLEQSYRYSLQSRIADQCHISTAPEVSAGAITAALFLETFAADVPWAHLDIAGPARATSASGVRQVGGTGFGVGLLAEWMRAGANF